MIRGRGDGFTLIEVLVAMAVFGVLSVVSYMALGQTLSNADMLGERMQRLEAIQRTIRYLDSDLMQAAPRPVRGLLGDGYEPAIRSSFGSEYALEVTHGGWTNPAGLPRGTLQRSAYRLEDGELIRFHWRVLDRTVNNEPIETVLLDGVESIEFRYLTTDGESSEQWPPTNVAGPAGFRLRPRGVEILVTLTDEGEIRRLVEIAP
jgi:general secretion pathway protein J